MAKHKREEWCKHYRAVSFECCKVDIPYDTFKRPGAFKLPCVQDDDAPECPQFELRSAEEIAAMRAAMEKRMDLLAKGLSGCCEAALDESQVIKEGRHKGHGTRFCSKCRKVAFMV